MQQDEDRNNLVLIAEDEDTNFFVLDLFIRKSFNLKTIRVINGVEAVETYKNHPEITLVLMDIKMPVMNGLEATKCIRSQNRSDAKTVPIIAMTANAFDEDVQQSKSAGMNAHLAKPINPLLLFSTLKEHIGKNKN